MLDYLIKGGLLVDGTGAPGRSADVGVRDGRVVAVGVVDERAAQTIDADGQVVAPGFIDPHTHYDAQLHWDGHGTPSSNHGVTSVVGGNCGFTLAPVRPGDGDYTRRMMAQVEGMPLAALENGIDWSFESFGQFLTGLEGKLAINAGFLVGHCALRRYVVGDESRNRQSTDDETARMVAVLHESLAAGGLGLSTTRSSSHPDHEGRPVASRLAGEEEVLTLCRAVSEHEGTTLEAIFEGTSTRFTEAEIELMAQMSAQANRPLNWNALTVGSSDTDRIEHQMLPSVRARQIGGRVVALTMPIFSDNNMSFGTYCALWIIPGWRDILILPLPDKIARLRDPAVRADLMAKARDHKFGFLADFAHYRLGDTIAPENKVLEGRLVAEVAAERSQSPFEALVEIGILDDFRTVLWPLPRADSAEDWETRRQLWERQDVLIGGSDAGAHLDRMLGSPYPTRFIADTLRGRRLVSLERAVQLMTDVPARYFGLRDRGRVSEGAYADLVVFDPDTIDSGAARRVYDLPGDSLRLTAEAIGVNHVLVNGIETVAQGKETGGLAGTVLRSGRDTVTVATR